LSEVLIHLLAFQPSSSRSLVCILLVLQTCALASFEDDNTDGNGGNGNSVRFLSVCQLFPATWCRQKVDK
jgi:hypothetical protein